MCKCDPSIKTPWCGKGECNPALDQYFALLNKINRYEKVFKEIVSYKAYSWNNDRGFIEKRIEELNIR